MQINIIGTRGVPAEHGGFETFAEKLAIYLRDRGHGVTVYCQDESGPAGPVEDEWEGIRRVHFVPRPSGPAGTIAFDISCVRDVLGRPGVDLVLGYNTAFLNILQLIRRRKVAINMDGIEWHRGKWSLPAKAWFFLNELLGANFNSSMIADHPGIADHLRRRSFRTATIIPYGADAILSAPKAPVRGLGLEPGRYFVSIARVEPENSILELVRAFSVLETDMKCVVLGRFDPDNAYHRDVRAAAGPNVVMPGAIYDKTVVRALRFHARCYLHGHTVGGTNPSLVEALGAGNAVLAHDNKFNRWTAGDGQFFFSDAAVAAGKMRAIIADDAAVAAAQDRARARHAEAFQWETVLASYEATLAALA